jgi:hypothetical protein
VRRDDESSKVADLRYLVTTLSCKAYEENCLNFELGRLKNFVEKDEGDYDLCNGLRLADEDLHSIFVEKFLAADNSDERINLMTYLGCSLDKKILKDYLNIVLDEANNLEEFERRFVLENTVTKSVVAYETVMEFFSKNHRQIVKL